MKAAVIGTGVIAKQHLGCLRELNARRGKSGARAGDAIEVAAVCDLSRAMAEVKASTG